MKVKICGLTNKDDAVWALNYGADYLGVNLWKESKRHVSLATATTWVPQLPSFASVVGVFVDAGQDEIVNAVVKLNLKGVQLHGDESPAMVSALRVALGGTGRTVFIVKAFRMQDESTLAKLQDYKDAVDYLLLDSFIRNIRAASASGSTGTSR
jgi:phosphoribosylanthranilate isomerase